MKKTIFITGASSGLGKATAKLFQAKGWNVIATMRNPEKDTELKQLPNVTVLKLNTTNAEQIKSAVATAINIHPVDVVFNNAGYGLIAPLESLTDEQTVKQIETNLLGVIRVTNEFIPHFREKKNGVFITTTSMGGFVAFPISSVYHATKFGLEGWSESLSHELSLFNIQVKTIAPGGILTDFSNRSLETGSHDAYKQLEAKMFEGIVGMMQNASTADKIAEVVYEAATDGKDRVRYLAGEDAKAIYARQLQLGTDEMRKEIRTQMLG